MNLNTFLDENIKVHDVMNTLEKKFAFFKFLNYNRHFTALCQLILLISFYYPFRNGFVSDIYWFGFGTTLGIIGHCVYGAKLEAATQTFRDHFISRRSTAPIIECQL